VKIRKEDIPRTIDAPGAVARQRQDFGEVTGYGSIAAEYFSLGGGADIAPLLVGLPGDSCHAPHWGYLLAGQITVTYTDGTEETVESGELFYWPPGHTVRVGRDAEVVLFSPAQEHNDVLDHMKTMMGA
jgi:hypothetical protein